MCSTWKNAVILQKTGGIKPMVNKHKKEKKRLNAYPQSKKE